MRAAFKMDILTCYKCGGAKQVIAAIPPGAIATKTLRHLGPPTQVVTKVEPSDIWRVRELIAAVQEKAQVERFLRHLGLWPDAEDIVAIRGPPDDMDYPDDDPSAGCDGTDDPEPLSWAA